MRPMNDFFNVDNLDLLSKDEKKFGDKYVKKLISYADGEVDGREIKHLTAGASTLAKKQQNRVAVAMLKWRIMQTGGDNLITQKQ